jgi:hypothetical protein
MTLSEHANRAINAWRARAIALEGWDDNAIVTTDYQIVKFGPPLAGQATWVPSAFAATLDANCGADGWAASRFQTMLENTKIQ